MLLLPIFLIVLVDVFAFTLVFPLLAIYAEHLGATAFEATLLVSIFAACQLVSGPLLGRASDRVGRKPMLIVSQAGTFIGLLVMAGARSLWVLYLARVIDGSTAGNLSLAQAYIADNTKPENRARSFGLIGIAFGLGFFLGPSVTGYLTQYGLRAPIYAAAGLSLTSILCTVMLLPAQRGTGDRRRPASAATGPGGQRLGILEWGAYAQFFERPVLAGLLLQMLLFGFAFTTFTSGFALFAERTFTWNEHPFTPREIGYLFAYAGFLGIILQGGLIGRLVKRFGEPALVGAGFLAMGLGYGLLGMIHELAPLIVVATLASFGQGVLRPTLTSLITQNAAADEQGVVLGLTQSLTSIAQVTAPPIGGWLIGMGRLGEWAFVAALASGLGLVATRWGSGRARDLVRVPQQAEVG
jgi:DHA1 family tetracycline resistance protein-like MFS transporter